MITKIASTAHQVESVAVSKVTSVTHTIVVLGMEIVTKEHALLDYLVGSETIFLITIQT